MNASHLITLVLSSFLAPLLLSSVDAHAGTLLTRQLRAPRVKEALRAHGAEVREAFRDADAAWPPRSLLMRAFKLERRLEVWAKARRGPDLVKVWTIRLCAESGTLGPKRYEGDGQIPEGFYIVNRFNPRSSFHLSMGLNYPNAVDRARTPHRSPGSDIFIHGGCASIGCLAITDAPIARLYLAVVMARDKGQRNLPVHLFPCRFGTEPCERALIDERPAPDVVSLWASLRRGFDEFEEAPRLVHFRPTAKGYRVP